MAKQDFPAWFDDEEQWKAHLSALENELTLLRARGNDRSKEVEEQIKLNGGSVPAKTRARAASTGE